jgi:hypothetical protein
MSNAEGKSKGEFECWNDGIWEYWGSLVMRTQKDGYSALQPIIPLFPIKPLFGALSFELDWSSEL